MKQSILRKQTHEHLCTIKFYFIALFLFLSFL